MKSWVALSLIFLTAIGLVACLARETKLLISFLDGETQLIDGAWTMARLETRPEKAKSLSIVTGHDNDGLWVMPWKQQFVEIEYDDGQRGKITLPKPTVEDVFREFWSRVNPKRQLFAGKVQYDDVGFYLDKTVRLEDKQIKRLGIVLTNVAEIRIKSIANEEVFSFWYRPKFHHDGSLELGELKNGVSINKRSQIYNYLKIVLSVILKGFLGGEILLLFLLSFKKPPREKLETMVIKSEVGVSSWFWVVLVVTAGAMLYTVTFKVLGAVPHSQDEVVYLFQSKIFSKARLYTASVPGELKRFFDHEFVVNNGRWFGSFPPGTSLFLAIGQILGRPELVNPTVSVINIVLVILLAKEWVGWNMGALSGALLLTSPFYLLVSSSFLSHPTAMLFSLCSVWCWIKIVKNPKKIRHWTVLAISLGALSLIRPANALLWCVLLVLGLIPKMIKGPKGFLVFGLVMLFFLGLNLAHNKAVTGSWFLFPHNLYSQFDKLGWGERGVEWGSTFEFKDSMANLAINLYSLNDMLFWPGFLVGAIILPVFWGRYRKVAVGLILLFLAQVGLYFFYFNEGTFLGPRFWFEALWIIPILSVMGMITLRDVGARSGIIVVTTSILWSYGMLVTLLALPSFKNFNTLYPEKIPPIEGKAVVFVDGRDNWQKYGAYFYRLDPFWNDQVIFARDGAVHNLPQETEPLENDRLRAAFPNRKFYLFKDEQLTKID